MPQLKIAITSNEPEVAAVFAAPIIAKGVVSRSVVDPLRRAICAMLKDPTVFEKREQKTYVGAWPDKLLDSLGAWAASEGDDLLLTVLERDAANVSPRPIIVTDIVDAYDAATLRVRGWRLVHLKIGGETITEAQVNDIVADLGIARWTDLTDPLKLGNVEELARTIYGEIVASAESPEGVL